MKEKITKESMSKYLGRPLLRPIGIIQLVFLIMMLLSPIIWIWFKWSIAWKVGLTGILGVLFCYWIYNVLSKLIDKKSEEIINRHPDIF